MCGDVKVNFIYNARNWSTGIFDLFSLFAAKILPRCSLLFFEALRNIFQLKLTRQSTILDVFNSFQFVAYHDRITA